MIDFEENDTTLAPIRLPKSLLNAARRKAARNDEKLSQVVRKALRAYVGGTEQLDMLRDGGASSSAKPRKRR